MPFSNQRESRLTESPCGLPDCVCMIGTTAKAQAGKKLFMDSLQNSYDKNPRRRLAMTTRCSVHCDGASVYVVDVELCRLQGFDIASRARPSAASAIG